MTIAAPARRVWQGLTDVDAVAAWANVTPVDIPSGYPQAGQYALWRAGPFLLHDVIVRVEPERRLVSQLMLGPHMAFEEYLLRSAGERAARFIATWRGHPALAINDAAMRRLKAWCEATVW